MPQSEYHCASCRTTPSAVYTPIDAGTALLQCSWLVIEMPERVIVLIAKSEAGANICRISVDMKSDGQEHDYIPDGEEDMAG